MKLIKRFLWILLPIILTACASTTLPAKNQPYLDAEKEITTLSPDQYLRLSDQTIYIGEVRADQQHYQAATGFGKLISPDGSIYQGYVKNGKAHGFGKSSMITGEIYKGEHQQGIFEGRGKLTLSDQSFFIGEFKNNKVYRGEMHFIDGKVATLQ